MDNGRKQVSLCVKKAKAIILRKADHLFDRRAAVQSYYIRNTQYSRQERKEKLLVCSLKRSLCCCVHRLCEGGGLHLWEDLRYR